jgi:hypothetical protein
MKKQVWTGVGVLLALAMIAVLAIPENRLTVLGYLRGENRFQGRPTSYWRLKVERYVVGMQNSATKATTFWEKLLEFISFGQSPRPSVLAGNTESLPVLIDLMKDKTSRGATVEVYKTLASMGTNAKDAVPLLIEALNDKDQIVRGWAAMALMRIDPGEAKKAGAEELIPSPENAPAPHP